MGQTKKRQIKRQIDRPTNKKIITYMVGDH